MSNSSLVDYVRIVSNKSKGRGGKKIDKIFVHHMAGNLSVRQCGNVFANYPTSAHYGVNGNHIGQYVKESDTAWHCGNFAYNQRSIGIELANDGGSKTNWHVSDKTIKTAIKLIADICKRNGIKKVNYTGDLKGNLCMHRWVVSTACPGGYLASKFKYIAREVNKLLAAKKKSSTKKSTGNKWTSYKVPFKVKVSTKDLHVRRGPSTAFKLVKVDGKEFIPPGIYTITSVKYSSKDKCTWGRLKSSTAKNPKWIALNYTTKV